MRNPERLRDLTARMRSSAAGVDFARQAIALAISDTRPQAERMAAERWGANSPAATALRMAAVSGGALTDADHDALVGTEVGPAEFLSVVRPLEIIGRLRPRAVPANVPVVSQADGATALWTSEGKAAPVSRTAFERTAIRPLRAPVLLIYSSEVLLYSSPAVEAMVLADMRRAVVSATDTAFIDRANAGVTGKIPRSVTYNAPSFESTGSIADDISGAIEIFDGDLSAAAWVMHPTVATRIALSLGAAANSRLGPRGGELVGLPAITSQSCNLDSAGGVITLVDASQVCVADVGISVDRSTASLIELSDSPTGDAIAPNSITAQPVSLFQTDSTGILTSRRINWTVGRANAVVCITSALYEGT